VTKVSPTASLARIGAARALMATETGAHLDEALATHAPPPGPDRDLAWFLAYGVMRRRGHLDAALRTVLTQPLAALDPPVRAALRIGTMELLFARTRPHAVVHQAVEVVRSLGAGRAHGLVNAVLRRVALPSQLSEPDRLDHPAWLVARWKERYGAEQTTRWCEANAQPPPLFVVAKDENARLPAGAEPATWQGEPVPGVYRVTSEGAVPSWAGFGEGSWWVQDLASVMVADLVPVEGAVLDACAAPGGKSFRMASRGAKVLAVDREAARLAKVREGAERLALSVVSVRHDWTQGPLEGSAQQGFPSGERPLFDAVLVDAPCTGLGTVRRHPEIRWRRTEPDLYGAAALQGRILDAVAHHVRPGGALIYAVCSPEPEEGEQVVDRFLARHPVFDRESVLSTAPPVDGEDAHFAARLRRVG
jgi:16S rRNA (cytosine967-C5)-methyltransferase